jgi:hypothetical protein
MRESTCGTLVLPLQIEGGITIYYASLIFIVLCAAIGFWLWFRYRDKSDPAIASQSMWMRFTSLIMVIGLAASYFGWWFLGLLTVLLAILSLGVFIIPRKV